jgi:hypothetical protein
LQFNLKINFLFFRWVAFVCCIYYSSIFFLHFFLTLGDLFVAFPIVRNAHDVWNLFASAAHEVSLAWKLSQWRNSKGAQDPKTNYTKNMLKLIFTAHTCITTIISLEPCVLTMRIALKEGIAGERRPKDRVKTGFLYR